MTEPVIIEARGLNCSSCWQFIYKFDIVSQKDPAIIDTATVTVTIVKGEIVDVVYVQGSKIK